MPYNYSYDLINKILPIHCDAYLKNKGWTETGKLGNAAKLFGKANNSGKFFEILVPAKTDAVDFKNVMIKLLLALQDFENRHFDYIANDIILSHFDVFRITAFKGDTSASLPLEDAKILLDKSWAMVASAAQSIISQQPFFQSRSSEVKRFLSRLRMGHTERGSFIVTLQTPIPPVITDQLQLLAEETLIDDEVRGILGKDKR